MKKEQTKQFQPCICGCGGQPEIKELSAGWHVRCKKCYLSTSNKITPEEAVAAWNKALGAEKA